jgi:NRPS condensation-like uncharacterized protein
MRKFFDGQLHCIISFDDLVDEKRLAQAVRLTLDAEPVLGCRFVERRGRSYWERREDLDRIELLRLIETPEREKEILKFMIEPKSAFKDPVVRCAVIRAQTDTLCIKLDHIAADAGGMKDYAYLVSSIYRELLGNPTYAPLPNLNGRRSMCQISERFNFSDKVGIIRRGFLDQVSLNFPRYNWSFPSRMTEPLDRTYVVMRIEADRFRAIKEFGKVYQATINDVILTAIFRALYDLVRPNSRTPLRLTNTVDLRRYLPSKKAEAICNLSSFSYPTIGCGIGSTFEETLIRVRDDMNARKADFFGLGDLPMGVVIFKGLPFSVARVVFHYAWGHMIRTGILPPDFTNMGLIEADQLNFGDTKVNDAFLTAGVTMPPFFGMGLSGYRESLTMSIGFCQSAIEKIVIERFFKTILSELPT